MSFLNVLKKFLKGFLVLFGIGMFLLMVPGIYNIGTRLFMEAHYETVKFFRELGITALEKIEYTTSHLPHPKYLNVRDGFYEILVKEGVCSSIKKCEESSNLLFMEGVHDKNVLNINIYNVNQGRIQNVLLQEASEKFILTPSITSLSMNLYSSEMNKDKASFWKENPNLLVSVTFKRR